MIDEDNNWILEDDNTLTRKNKITPKFIKFKNKFVCIRCWKRLCENNLEYCEKCKNDIDEIEERERGRTR